MRFVRFNLTTGAISILGNAVFTTLLAQRTRMPLLAANGTAIALCALLNYLASDRLVFRGQREEFDRVCDVRPYYVRKSDAEIAWDQRRRAG